MSLSDNSRLSVVSVTDSGQTAVVEFAEEDHTLCNALRHEIVTNPSVKFCGYSMPHPNEAKCLMQIQTTGQLLALDALRQGLTDLMLKCQHLKTTFIQKHNQFVG